MIYNKINALLFMLKILLSGEYLETSKVANKFNITERTVRRYISHLKNFLAEEHDYSSEIIYIKGKGYLLVKTNQE